jgi:hypothetical protein
VRLGKSSPTRQSQFGGWGGKSSSRMVSSSEWEEEFEEEDEEVEIEMEMRY